MSIHFQNVKSQRSKISETVISIELLIIEAIDHKMPTGESK